MILRRISYNKQAACLQFIKKVSIFKMIFRSWDLTENDGKKRIRIFDARKMWITKPLKVLEFKIELRNN